MIYLDELLSSDNFTMAASRIAQGFRDRYELPLLHQLGIVVPDIEAAASTLEARGMGPFFIISGSPVFWNERGRLRDISIKIGLAYHRGVELELIEPGENAEFYRDRMGPSGRMAVHHLGFLVDDVDVHAAVLEKDGLRTWVRGTIHAFPSTAQFAYMDTEARAGIIVEYITMRYFGLRLPMPHAVFHGLGRLEKTLGLRCMPMM
jgi:hypothetical protein